MVLTASPEPGRFSETDDHYQPQKKLCERAVVTGSYAGLLRADRSGQCGYPACDSSVGLDRSFAVRFQLLHENEGRARGRDLAFCIPHSTFRIPHSSFLIPHSNGVLIEGCYQ